MILTAAFHLARLRPGHIFAGATLALAACTAPGPVAKAQFKGVGTPGVSAYMGQHPATGIQALLDRCAPLRGSRDVPANQQTLQAACDQLHRTMHNQPGNSVQAPALE